MKRAIVLLLIFPLTLAACDGSSAPPATGGGSGAGSAVPTHTFTLSLMQGPGKAPAYYEAMMDTVKKIEARTGGDVKFDVYPFSQLGDYLSVANGVMQGSIDMAILTNANTYDNRVDLAHFPYGVLTYETLKKVYAPGSYLYDLLDGIYKSQGVKFFGLFTCGFCGIGFSEYPKDYADPYVSKNLTVRVPINTIVSFVVEALGYKALPIAWIDTHHSMQQGIVEGYAGTPMYSGLNYFADVTRYWVDYGYSPEPVGIIMNQGAYDRLAPGYQKIFVEEFAALALASVDLAKQRNEDAVGEWEALGVTVIRLTDAEREAIVTKVVEEVWPKLEAQYGAEAVRALRDALGI